MHQPFPLDRRAAAAVAFLLCLAAGQPATAVVPPDDLASTALTYSHPDLRLVPELRPVSRVSGEVAARRAPHLAALGAAPEGALLDVRGGTWARLLLTEPLLPGDGVANHLAWAQLGVSPSATPDQRREAIAAAFGDYVRRHAGELSIRPSELAEKPEIGLYEDGRLVQIHAARVVAGIPVRRSFLTAVVRHGNLVLLGTSNWGPIDVSLTPTVSAEAARRTVAAHAEGFALGKDWREPRLELVPTGAARPDGFAPGEGYAYRLAWVLSVRLSGSRGSWEALVDAHSGELLQFGDRNQHLQRRLVGGIFPVSNDGRSVEGVPDGVEQPRFPMPHADVVLPDGTVLTTNSAGLVDVDGPFQTTLAGPFVRIGDNCGPVEETSSCQEYTLGTSGGTDCTIPPLHSLGDTHSSRTGFYELNRIIEQAKGWVGESGGASAWLNSQLPANMNINDTCNAFWSPTEGSVNFFKEGLSSGGTVICRNTGEIAAVFDHEWGHGLDNNDTIPDVSFPGEAYADIAAILRLDTSCIGRGFLKSRPDGSQLNQLFCGGNGDPCTECSGVREDDWMKRQSGVPHDIDWILGVNQNGAPGGCSAAIVDPLPTPFGLGAGPCGFGTHCEGTIVGEAIWDLLKRDLRCNGIGWEQGGSGTVGGGQCVGGAAPAMDENTALELVARMFYLGATNVESWYVCNPAPVAGGNPFAGCNADSGYLQFLAVDDDNGNLLDGTPHMQAIFDAFDRHQIACDVPPAQNGGCAGAPTQAPTVTATARLNGADVSWTTVPGAEKYWVFRTEGVHGCDFGKVRIAEVTGTSFSDDGLLGGLEYFYSVIPVGGSDACSGPMSACASATPSSPADAAILPDLTALTLDRRLAIATGDGDDFVDNCEQASLAFDVFNSGGTTLSNVQLSDVRPVSHPDVRITSQLPIPVAASLPAGCGTTGTTAEASFSFVANGLSHGDTLTFEADVAANELPLPVTATLTVHTGESDLQPGDLTFDFEDGEQGWEVRRGTFERTNVPPPGAELSSWYIASSALLDNQCDQIRSPAVRLTAESTLSLFNQFEIEPTSDAPFDRANVGLVDPATGQRELIIPDGGARPYNVPDGSPNGACVTGGQGGWNGLGPDWQDATWSPSALGVAGLGEGDRQVQIDVAYGTDPLISGSGFWFDQVRITNALVPAPDGQSDSCQVENNAPTAVDDAATTEEDTPVDVDVLANDSDPDGDALAVSEVGDPPHGTATDNGDGTVTYAPDAGFTGSDSFAYTASDPFGGADTATVRVTVYEDTDPAACNEIDDADPAVDYRRGWHRRTDSAASNGGYHRRMGGNQGGNGPAPTARITFRGNEVTYFFAMAENGGTAEIFIDGQLQETLSYAASGQSTPSFGHKRTYSGLGEGEHVLVIEHVSGAVYVDGFGFSCDEAGAGADASAAAYHSETEVSQAQATEGAVIERTTTVSDLVEEISVVVEGSLVPLTVELLDPSGEVIATGEALIDRLTASGLDAPVSTPGAYTVQVVNVAGAFETIEISIARMVRNQ